MADFSVVTSAILALLGNALTWVVFFFVGLGLFIFFKKRQLLKKQDQEIRVVTPLGRGKINIEKVRAGLIKKDRIFNKLIEKGEEKQFETTDGRIIYGAVASDYNEEDGKRVLYVTQNPGNPKQLFPLRSFDLDNSSRKILMNIPPMEITEAAVDQYRQSTKEMKSDSTRMMEIFGLGILVVGFVLAAIFLTQWSKNANEHAAKINADSTSALKDVATKLVEISNNFNARSSTTAP